MILAYDFQYTRNSIKDIIKYLFNFDRYINKYRLCVNGEDGWPNIGKMFKSYNYKSYYNYIEWYKQIHTKIYNSILYLIYLFQDLYTYYFKSKKLVIKSIDETEFNYNIIPKCSSFLILNYYNSVRERNNIHILDIKEIPNTFINLRYLDISNTNISSIPDEFVNLEILLCNNCKSLVSLPKTFTKLKKLYCSNTNLYNIPEEYTYLEHINCKSCVNITTISDKFNLKELYISDTQIRSLSKNWVNLECLIITNNNYITYIPKIFTKLESLGVEGTKIEYIPEFVNLKSLFISRTIIKALPNTLTKLNLLAADESCLNYIPETFQNLEYLFLDKSELITFIPKLTKLKHLNIKKASNIKFIDDLESIKTISFDSDNNNLEYISYKTLEKDPGIIDGEMYYRNTLICTEREYPIKKVPSLYIKAYNIVSKNKKSFYKKSKNSEKNLLYNIFNYYEKPIQCPKCGKYFDDIYYLNKYRIYEDSNCVYRCCCG